MQHNSASPALVFPHTQPPGPGRLIEIAPGVQWFRLPLPYRLDHVNIYLIENDDGWTVLDTGLGTDACRTAWEAVLSGPLKRQRLTEMIVTHSIQIMSGLRLAHGTLPAAPFDAAA